MRFLVVAVLAVSIAACAQQPRFLVRDNEVVLVTPSEDDAVLDSRPVVAKESEWPMADGWQSSEVLVATEASSRNPPFSRRGTSPSGRRYSFWPDGSGGIGEFLEDDYWTVRCLKDAMSDVRSCYLRSDASGLYFTVERSVGLAWVCVSRHDYPGKQAMIRVDDASPITTNTDGCNRSAALKVAVVDGRKVVVRRYEWPHDYPRDKTGSLNGSKEALSLARWLLQNMDTIEFSPPDT